MVWAYLKWFEMSLAYLMGWLRDYIYLVGPLSFLRLGYMKDLQKLNQNIMQMASH